MVLPMSIDYDPMTAFTLEKAYEAGYVQNDTIESLGVTTWEILQNLRKIIVACEKDPDQVFEEWGVI